ncbi:hypothetical protein CHARACLAT_032262 [Characodon lateralis]|uniref:Uncharacterized protein n=1 Tax=Characodon lateralis TaxID=208331 RepID=A0ABU7CX14_9TELE|nr:hypothetical protein [Characodon lateralis]
MGLRSGIFDVIKKCLTLSYLSHFVTDFAAWLESLSILRTHLCPSFIFLADVASLFPQNVFFYLVQSTCVLCRKTITQHGIAIPAHPTWDGVLRAASFSLFHHLKRW